mgnify:CR=1 FL=1
MNSSLICIFLQMCVTLCINYVDFESVIGKDTISKWLVFILVIVNNSTLIMFYHTLWLNTKKLYFVLHIPMYAKTLENVRPVVTSSELFMLAVFYEMQL